MGKMKKFLVPMVLLGSLLLCGSAFAGAIVYVNSNAAAGGDGGPNDPYISFDAALRSVDAGGTIYFNPGNYTIDILSSDTDDGFLTISQDLSIDVWPGRAGDVTWDFGGEVPGGAIAGRDFCSLLIGDADGVVDLKVQIKNITFKNFLFANGGGNPGGLWIASADIVSIDSCTFEATPDGTNDNAAIAISADAGAGNLDKLAVVNCTFTGNSYTGISARGVDENIVIYNNSFTATGFDSGINDDDFIAVSLDASLINTVAAARGEAVSIYSNTITGDFFRGVALSANGGAIGQAYILSNTVELSTAASPATEKTGLLFSGAAAIGTRCVDVWDNVFQVDDFGSAVIITGGARSIDFRGNTFNNYGAAISTDNTAIVPGGFNVSFWANNFNDVNALHLNFWTNLGAGADTPISADENYWGRSNGAANGTILHLGVAATQAQVYTTEHYTIPVQDFGYARLATDSPSLSAAAIGTNPTHQQSISMSFGWNAILASVSNATQGNGINAFIATFSSRPMGNDEPALTSPGYVDFRIDNIEGGKRWGGPRLDGNTKYVQFRKSGGSVSAKWYQNGTTWTDWDSGQIDASGSTYTYQIGSDTMLTTQQAPSIAHFTTPGVFAIIGFGATTPTPTPTGTVTPTPTGTVTPTTAPTGTVTPTTAPTSGPTSTPTSAPTAVPTVTPPPAVVIPGTTTGTETPITPSSNTGDSEVQNVVYAVNHPTSTEGQRILDAVKNKMKSDYPAINISTVNVQIPSSGYAGKVTGAKLASGSSVMGIPLTVSYTTPSGNVAVAHYVLLRNRTSGDYELVSLSTSEFTISTTKNLVVSVADGSVYDLDTRSGYVSAEYVVLSSAAVGAATGGGGGGCSLGITIPGVLLLLAPLMLLKGNK